MRKKKTPVRRLPAWSEPGGLAGAAAIITKLGHNIQEHAYLVGKTLIWVKEKVGHGKFLQWLEENVWFSQRTAYNMMGFAESSEKSGFLLEYRPAKFAMVASLPSPTPRKHSDHDISRDEQKKKDFGGESSEDFAPEDAPEKSLSSKAEPAWLERFDFIQPPTDPEEEDEPLTGELLYRRVEQVIREKFFGLPLSEQSEFLTRIGALLNDIETELGLF